MMTKQAIHDQILYYSKQLRLPAFRNEYEHMAKQSASNRQPFEHYLLDLMKVEYEQRAARRIKQRISRANFPYKKFLADIIVSELPDDAQAKIDDLARLDFIKQGRNLILAGNPGTGKTHMAISLAIQACQNDSSVLFTTVTRLITQIKESRSQKSLRVLESRFEKYDLVICDEFGYVSYDKDAAEILFTHLSLRAGLKSIIITTNLGFDRWSEIFTDQVLTAAMVDRLTHKAVLINMNGKSFRVKDSKKLNSI